MRSPFPGTDPYLELLVFWLSFHTRLIVAIADAITPQLGSQYYVEVESRTYQSDEAKEDLLIGIPDAVVFADREAARSGEPLPGDIASIATQMRPEKVGSAARISNDE